MRVCVLGPVEAWEDGRELALGPVRQRALFALLHLHAGDVVSTDRLIDALWGERPPASAAKLLQGYVSQLRRALPQETIVTRGAGYLLRAGETDAAEFEGLVDRARGEVPAAAAATLRNALALWRGSALSDVEYEPWAQAEIGRLQELRLVALEQRIDADLQVGEAAHVLPELENLVDEHPLREGLRAQLMLALYRAGRQTEALDAFADARRRLVDELGIEPGKPLRELHQAILRQDPVLDAASQADSAAEEARSPFVGRAEELAELTAALEGAIAGRGSLFFLVGEPGIGKSRLAEEVMRHATRRGLHVLVGRCWEAGGAPAYWPWVQSLRNYARETEADALRTQLGAGAVEVAQIVPELRERFPDLPGQGSAEPDGARFRLFDATAEFLRNASAARPILLVLDDLHAADESSLLLLRFVARGLGCARMLVLGAYRDVDPLPGDSLSATLAEVGREPFTRRLSLGGLSELDVVDYLDQIGGATSPEVALALHGETEGNPLFLSETVRLLSLEHGSRAIPQTVRDVIARRLTHLSDECNQLLLLASVLGREFALAALARLSGTEEDVVLTTLDEAMVARVVLDVPGAPDRFRFGHILMRDTLYEGMTAARRVALHRRAVDAIAALYGDESGAHLAELAHHAIAGGDFEQAVLYAGRAGDRALLLLAYEEAARLYRTALEALDLLRSDDDAARCTLLLSLGETEAQAGNAAAAKEAFLSAAGIARRIGLPRELAYAAAGYGGRIVWSRAGDDQLLVPLLEEGLSALGDTDVELRARLLARLAGALRDEPSRERRDALSREAVELARSTANVGALAYALDGRGAAIVAADTVTELLALGTELCEVAARGGDRERVSAGHSWRVMAQLLAGDVAGAQVDFDAASEIAEELRQPVYLWQKASSGVMFALARGRLDEAARLIPAAFARGESAFRDMAVTHDRLHRYTLADFRGTLPEIESEIRELAAAYPARPVFRCVVARLDAGLGNLPEARRALSELATDEFSFLPFDQEWLFGMSFLADTSALVADSAAAATLYRQLEPWASFNAVDVAEGIRGSVARYLGLLAITLENWDDAERHFEHALAVNEHMGLRPWVAHTQSDYGRMLLARGDYADAERARGLSAAAQSAYRELGMSGYVEG